MKNFIFKKNLVIKNLIIFCIVFIAKVIIAQELGEIAQKVCNIKLTSEVEPDMTSVDSVLKSIIKPSMNDEEKCIEVIKFVNEHRFWAPSSRGTGPGTDEGGTDPILLLNSFTPTICQQDAALCSAFWACLGYDVRYWQLKGHTTSEVKYGGRWRNLDATFPEITRSSDGTVIGVIEGNQRYKPGVSYIEKWDDYVIAHKMVINLRKGESFTRYWYPLSTDVDYWRPASNKSIPTDGGDKKWNLNSIIAKKPYKFDTKGVGFANGILEFKPNFSQSNWKDLLEYEENIKIQEINGEYVVGILNSGKKGIFVLKVYTSYILTGGWFEGEIVKEKEGDKISIFVSNDNGINWNMVYNENKGGKIKIPLREFIGDKLSYLVKIELEGETIGIKNINIKSIVQVNPLSLPALKLGENSINFDVGEQLERITFMPDINKPSYRAEILEEKNLLTAREQQQEGWVSGLCVANTNEESYLIVKISSPGNIKRVNWGGRFKKGTFQLFYSFDGKQWEKQDVSYKYIFPNSDTPKYFVPVYEPINNIPSDLRTVYLKYSFRIKNYNELCELQVATFLRADVDYLPKGIGKFPKIKVTYCWEEENHDKRIEQIHSELISYTPYNFKIKVSGEDKPLMKWVKIEYPE